MKETTGTGDAVLAEDAHLLRPLLDHARLTPERALLASRSGARFVTHTAREVEQTVRRLARGLLAIGVEPGQRVALMSRTRLEWALLDFAILMAGGVTVPIYDTSSADQVEWIVQDSEAEVAFFEHHKMHAVFQSVAERLPRCRQTFVIDEGAFEHLMRLGEGVDAGRVEERLAGLRASSLATIIYTSGTTGRPKGCMLSHGNLRANVRQVLQLGQGMLRPEDRTLLFLPLAHSLAKILFLLSLELGAEVAFSSGISQLNEELLLVRPDWMVAVPRVFEKIFHGAQRRAWSAGKEKAFSLAEEVAIRTSRERAGGHLALRTRVLHAVLDRLVYRRLRAAFGGRLRFAVSGGGPLSERLTRFFDGVGVEVLEGYGLTESSPVLTLNVHSAWKPGSVGRPLPGTTLRIADDGEVLARGPQVFEGYWHNEAATRDTLTPDGWLRTGDLGSLDEDGYLRITGRKKELLVTAGGKNVAPAPLEERLRAHPLVSQAVVVGDGLPFVAALVTLDAERLRDWAGEHGRSGQTVEQLVGTPELRAELQHAIEDANRPVSRAEAIREFAILPNDFTVESDELTPSLKVKRGLVTQRYASVISAMYAQP
ncbi:AMP-dependent synthetase/ligase [Pyxidicoccus trucidator]|uniref:AMP-dependent synthetase/ligase n=1 Tax=Pyxidicoccus trucidator TaxID=2709662 RepID=UPI0013D9E0E8|nr:long-chain fatty acid--CoA ligase [Pyxidicoccus trucidator]